MTSSKGGPSNDGASAVNAGGGSSSVPLMCRCTVPLDREKAATGVGVAAAIELDEDAAPKLLESESPALSCQDGRSFSG